MRPHQPLLPHEMHKILVKVTDILFIAVVVRMDARGGRAVETVVIVMISDVVVAVSGGRERKGIDDAVLSECFHVVAVALRSDLAEGVSVLSGEFSIARFIWLYKASPATSNVANLYVDLED